MNIKELSEIENAFVKAGETQYKKYYTNATDLLSLLDNLIIRYTEDAFTFHIFYFQAKKALALSLLSIIRRHDIQTHLNLRYALESACLACFAIKNPDPETFAKEEETGLLTADNNVLCKSYKWLNENYPDFSKTIKNFKDKINSTFAHSNIINAYSNILKSDDEWTSYYFDWNTSDLKHNFHMIRSRFWWVANIIWGLSKLIATVIHDHSKIEIIKDFESKLADLGKQNDQLKTLLMESPTFAKHNPKNKDRR